MIFVVPRNNLQHTFGSHVLSVRIQCYLFERSLPNAIAYRGFKHIGRDVDVKEVIRLEPAAEGPKSSIATLSISFLNVFSESLILCTKHRGRPPLIIIL